MHFVVHVQCEVLGNFDETYLAHAGSLIRHRGRTRNDGKKRNYLPASFRAFSRISGAVTLANGIDAVAHHAVDADLPIPADKLDWMQQQLIRAGRLKEPRSARTLPLVTMQTRKKFGTASRPATSKCRSFAMSG